MPEEFPRLSVTDVPSAVAASAAVLPANVPSALRDVQAALLRLETGVEVTERDAEFLFSARGPELDRLLTIASRLRDEGLDRAGRTGVITYSRKVFIPITFLCRDRCHYCIFVETPGKLLEHGKPTYLSPQEIVQLARDGAALGCKEALFTLGDRPEERWPSARAWLDEHGYASTLDYIRAMAILVLEETGLLPHLNPGVMSWSELQALRPVAPSMGMMLETTATRLWSEKGGVHYGSPDKDPALRLQVLDDAGRSRIPFTTGVLLGIGENNADRAEALFAIRASHQRYGHIQETIVQNFRAKPKTAMQNEVDLALQEYVAAVAVTRVVMGADATVQAPPNLTDANELGLLIRAGIDDWGGVSPLTADHVNPERPWPELDDLASLTLDAGFRLSERLTAHPPFVNAADHWVDERIRPHVAALALPNGLADEAAPVVGRPFAFTPRSPSKPSSTLRRASDDPAGLTDADYVELLASDGDSLEALAAVADELRSSTVGDAITFVVNRNIDSSLALSAEVLSALANEARDLGATEICIQGPLPSRLPGSAYLDLIAAIHTAQPGLHLHAFRPTEIADGAARLGVPIPEYLGLLRAAGVDSVPGTGARILNDRVRAILSNRADPPAATWIELISAAHRAGLPSTATMVFGHVETAVEQVAHLRTLAALQDETGGFTEFIPMPFLPLESPPIVGHTVRHRTDVGAGDGADVGAGDGTGFDAIDVREARALVAVARLMLHGRIDHIQAAWPKVGLRTSQLLLQGGADDLGGLLLAGSIVPAGGAEAFRSLARTDIDRIASEIGRPVRQRLTNYGVAPIGYVPPARSKNAAAIIGRHLPGRDRSALGPVES